MGGFQGLVVGLPIHIPPICTGRVWPLTDLAWPGLSGSASQGGLGSKSLSTPFLRYWGSLY